jgi:hypothetical protein
MECGAGFLFGWRVDPHCVPRNADFGIDHRPLSEVHVGPFGHSCDIEVLDAETHYAQRPTALLPASICDMSRARTKEGKTSMFVKRKRASKQSRETTAPVHPSPTVSHDRLHNHLHLVQIIKVTSHGPFCYIRITRKIRKTLIFQPIRQIYHRILNNAIFHASKERRRGNIISS